MPDPVHHHPGGERVFRVADLPGQLQAAGSAGINGSESEGRGESSHGGIEEPGRAAPVHVVFVHPVAIKPGCRQPRLPHHALADLLELFKIGGRDLGGLELWLRHDPAGSVKTFLPDHAIGQVLPGCRELVAGQVEVFLFKGRRFVGFHHHEDFEWAPALGPELDVCA